MFITRLSMYADSAFVLKNFYPYKQTVILLHDRLGKIKCIYNKKDHVAHLTTGTYITCLVEKKKQWYEIAQFDIIFAPEYVSLSKLNFIHHIVLLCLKLLPDNVVVKELFDYLSYCYQNFSGLTDISQNIVLLRLFLLFDLLPEDNQIYRCALQDPYGSIKFSEQDISSFVLKCWQRFHHEVRP